MTRLCFAARSLHLRRGTADCTLTTTSQPLAIIDHVDGRYAVPQVDAFCDALPDVVREIRARVGL